MHKVTLGIPIYNAADLIERTILSALNQTYPNIEYLFIDDKGNSMDVVRRVVECHPRHEAVQIIDQKYNQGIGAARNAIVEHATGEYLFTMDCDDVIVPDCIEILYNKMQEHPVDFVAASFVCHDLKGGEYPGCQYVETLVEGGEHPVAEFRYGRGRELFVATWNKLYRTEFLRANHIRCLPYHLNEDPWFTYQVVMFARSCRLIPDVTLYYTYNPDSVSGIAASQGYSERIAMQYEEIERLKSQLVSDYSSEPFYIGALVDIIWMGMYFAYRVLISVQLEAEVKRRLAYSLLKRKYAKPEHYRFNAMLIKYSILHIYWGMPVKVKYTLLKWAASFKLKDKLRRWIHF